MCDDIPDLLGSLVTCLEEALSVSKEQGDLLKVAEERAASMQRNWWQFVEELCLRPSPFPGPDRIGDVDPGEAPITDLKEAISISLALSTRWASALQQARTLLQQLRDHPGLQAPAHETLARIAPLIEDTNEQPWTRFRDEERATLLDLQAEAQAGLAQAERVTDEEAAEMMRAALRMSARGLRAVGAIAARRSRAQAEWLAARRAAVREGLELANKLLRDQRC